MTKKQEKSSISIFFLQITRRIGNCIFVFLSFLEMMENSTHCFTTWYNAAICTVCVHSLTETAVDFADLHAWWNEPDMVESNDGKLTAPLGSNAATKKEGH